MSQENVERARERYAALRRAVQSGDLNGFLRDYVAPDIEWVPLPGSPDSVAVQQGHEAVQARFAEMLEAVEEPSIEAEQFIDAGDKTVVGVRLLGRGRASGVEVEWRPFHVVTEKHGKLVRIEWYTSREEALKAVGLED